MDKKERAAIRDVLIELRRQGEREQRDARFLDEDPGIAIPLAPMSHDHQLEYVLHTPSGQFRDDEVIRMAPPRRGWPVVALWCRWGGGHEPGCVFYIGMWTADGKFLGFRFEPPGEGNHAYYHSQLCRSMNGDKPIAGALEVPERIPALPLPAGSSLELLLCAVLSIYGMDGLEEMSETFNGDPMRYHTVIGALDKVAALSPTP